MRDDLGRGKLGQFVIAKIFRLFRDVVLDRLPDDKCFLRAVEAHIHLAFERGVLAEKNFRRHVFAEKLEAQLRFARDRIRRGDFSPPRISFSRECVVFLPALQIGNQILDHGAIGLVLDRRFQSPFVVRLPQLDLVIAVLNDDAVEFVAFEINHVAGARFASSVFGPLLS